MIHNLFSKISPLTLTEHYEMLVKLFLNQLSSLSFSVVTNADGFDYNFFIYHHQYNALSQHIRIKQVENY